MFSDGGWGGGKSSFGMGGRGGERKRKKTATKVEKIENYLQLTLLIITWNYL